MKSVHRCAADVWGQSSPRGPWPRARRPPQKTGSPPSEPTGILSLSCRGRQCSLMSFRV